jgi:hypothetical protein
MFYAVAVVCHLIALYLHRSCGTTKHTGRSRTHMHGHRSLWRKAPGRQQFLLSFQMAKYARAFNAVTALRTSPASYQYNFQSLLGRVHRPLFLSCRAPWCSEQGPQHPVASTLRHASHQAFRKVKSSAWVAAATGVSTTAAAATGVTAAPSCVHLFPGSGPVTSVVVTPLASLAGLGRRELLIAPV